MHHLVLVAGVHIDLSGMSFQRISIATSAPIAFLVEFNRLVAAAVKEQIGLNLAWGFLHRVT